MASSDSIMMDSPAQTPDPKGQFSAPPGPPPTDASTDVLMAVDNQASEGSGWDTKKWREDLQFVTSRLQHAHWIPGKELSGCMTGYLVSLQQNRVCADVFVRWGKNTASKYRDPMSKPLVTQPRDLTPEMDSRIREYYQQRKARIQQAL